MHLPGSHHRSSEQQQELRDARRLLRERIKDDWEYPTLPAWRSSGKKEPATEEDIEDKIAGFRFHTPSDHDREGPNASNGALGLSFNPMEWREREYSDLDASDTDGEPSPVKEEASASAKHKRSEYKFDGPDSVGAQLSERRHARKRRRQVRLQEEMEWNDGLAHWMRRRDIWCSARTVAEVRSHESPAEEDADADADSASTSSPRASTSSSAEEEEEDGDQAADETPESTPSSTPDMTASTPPHVPPPSPMQVLVPIAPPLLPNHPIRRRINRNMYPEIYTKIILQSRTPSIPINLLTLIKALVQGWKDDGEWPPKNVPVEKSIGRKKAKDGLKEKMGRVLRFTGTGTGTGE